MASIKYDSEFMTNLVAGKPVSPIATSEGETGIPGNPKKRFAVIMDEHRQPMVVHLSDESRPKLQIIRHDEKDVLHVFDLGQAFDIPLDASVQAFDVTQDDSLNLYLSFAYLRTPTTSNLVIAKPLTPNCLVPGRKLEKLEGESTDIASVKQIIMTRMWKNSGTLFPFVILTHQIKGPNQLMSEAMSTIWAPNLNSWSKTTDVIIPGSYGTILKIAPSTAGQWHGFYLLYDFKGQRKLASYFMGLDAHSAGYKRIMHGAMLQPEYDNIFTLGTVRDYEDADAPMISTSEGLFFEPWSRSFLVYGQWKRLSGDKNFQSCKNLQATHWGDDQCIWFRSSLNEVGYVRTNTNTIKDKRRDMLPAPVLLLPAGDSLCAEPLMIGEFAGHIWQSLFVADYNGSLTHLQQASDTGHWLQKPFYTYHSEGTHDVDGYTITIRPLQEDQSPLIGGLVQIRSSSAVTGYLNGRNVTLSPSPRWYLADFEGSLNFIVPTTSMACPILTIDGLQTATKTPLDVSRTVIDPSKKVEARWDEIIDSCQSWKDFKSFKLENGRTIFPQHEGPPDEDLQHGFDQFKTLQIARKRLHPDGTVAFFDGADGSVIPPPEGLFDILSDAWHYVTKMAHNVEHWFVESANEFLRFVCKIGNKVFKLVLDTVEKVMHAMSWVWKKLKTVIKDLINILGHIFNRKEIISTKNSISALLTSSIDLLAEKAGDAGERLSSKMSEAAKTMREGQARSDIGEKISSDSNPSLKGLSYNTSVAWMGERMKNGGMATMPQNEHGLTSHPEVTKCWNKTLPHVQSMQRHVNGLANKVNSNRAQKGSMTSGQTFTLLQEFAQPGVDTLKLIAGGMLDGLHALLQQISKYGNAKITIPVLSGLYKTIVGHDLTVFDAVSLILGFVTNAITSIVTGQAPPVIPDLQSSTTLGRLVGVYTPRLPAKAITDFHTLTGGLVVTCTILYRIVEYFKLLKQIATGGVKVSSGIGITDCLWAIFQGVYTIHSFPTDPDMPGMVFRGQICAFNIVKNVTHILAACMSGVSSKEESAAGEVAQGLGVDTFVVIVDTAVSAITSGLGILVGGFELDESTWKNFSIEGSTAGIVGCILNVVKDVSYFVLFIAPEEVVESVPGYFIWQGASDGLILVTCFKWRCDFDLDAKHLPHRVLSGQVGSRVHSLG